MSNAANATFMLFCIVKLYQIYGTLELLRRQTSKSCSTVSRLECKFVTLTRFLPLRRIGLFLPKTRSTQFFTILVLPIDK